MILPFVKKYPLAVLTTLFFFPPLLSLLLLSEQSQVKPEIAGTLLCIQREQMGLEEGKTYPWIPDSCPGTPHRRRYHLYEFFRKCIEVFGQGKGVCFERDKCPAVHRTVPSNEDTLPHMPEHLQGET